MEPNSPEKERLNGIVRPLQKGDIPALREILEYWLRDSGIVAQDEVEKDISTLKESLNDESGKKMFVVEAIHGKVVGMMGLAIRPKQELIQFAKTDSPSELIIAYVHPEQRNKGVGTALITAVQELAKAKGRKEIILESGPRNIRTGYPFYDSQPGFRRAGRINDFYGKGLHTMVWQKIF